MSMNWLHKALFLSLPLLLPSMGVRYALARPQLAQQTSRADFDSLAGSATAEREAGKVADAIRDYARAVALRPDWEEGWWYVGSLNYDSDHFAEAIPAFQTVVKLNPHQGAAWNFLGLCEFETGNYENSLQHLQKGQEIGPGDDPEVVRVSQFHLALLLNRYGEFERASSILLASIVGSSSAEHASAQIKLALGLSVLRVPLLPKEVDPSKEARVMAVGEVFAALKQHNDEATWELFQTLLRDNPDTPYLHYACALALADAGRDSEALIELKEELRISPESPEPRIKISELQLRAQDPKEALRAAQDAVRSAPNSRAALHALAESWRALGSGAQASAANRRASTSTAEKPHREARMIRIYGSEPVNQAAGVNPTGNAQSTSDIDANWNAALAAYQANRYPEAIAALKAFVKQRSDFGTAWAVLGLSEFATKDYDSALIHLERGQELGMGGSAESVMLGRYHLAILLIRNRKFDRANQLLAPDAQTKMRSKEIQFALGLGLLQWPILPDDVEASKRELVQSVGEVAELLQESKYDAALPRLQVLLQQNPSQPFLHYVFGTALVSLSQFEEAKAAFSRETDISPTNELSYIRMAAIELRLAQPSAGVPLAKRAVDLAPNSGEAHYILGRCYLDLGQEALAVQELEVASKIAPNSPEVHFNLAKAYAKAKRFDKEAAERATFAQLNALAEYQRSVRGDQSYGGSRDTTNFQEHPSGTTPAQH